MTGPNGAGHHTGSNGHDATAAQPPHNGPRFGIIPRWVARLDLTGAEHRVLLDIACHARKETRITPPRSIEQISDELNLDRRTVQRAVRHLEAECVLRLRNGGGRGRASAYQIIFEPPAAAANSGNDTAVSDVDDTKNSGNDAAFFEETAANSSLNSGQFAAPTELEQKELPLAGESHARERGDFSQNDEVERRQGVLLLPIDGGGERMAPLKCFEPSAELVDWASALYAVNARDDGLLGKFRDWHLEHNKLPADLEAAYRNWIRNEATRFAERDDNGSRRRRRNSSTPAEAEAAARYFEKLCAFRANGGLTANG